MAYSSLSHAATLGKPEIDPTIHFPKSRDTLQVVGTLTLPISTMFEVVALFFFFFFFFFFPFLLLLLLLCILLLLVARAARALVVGLSWCTQQTRQNGVQEEHRRLSISFKATQFFTPPYFEGTAALVIQEPS